jgi:hypothetical protein
LTEIGSRTRSRRSGIQARPLGALPTAATRAPLGDLVRLSSASQAPAGQAPAGQLSDAAAALASPAGPPSAQLARELLAGATVGVSTVAKVSAAGPAVQPAARGVAVAGVARAVLPIVGAIAGKDGDVAAKEAVASTTEASTAVIDLHAASTHFNQAAQAVQAVRDGAAPPAAAPNLTGLGRVAGVLDVTRGVLVAPKLATQIKTVAEHPDILSNGKFSRDLAGNFLAVANGALMGANLIKSTGFAARLSPWVGSAADVTLISAGISDMKARGASAPGILEVAAYATDLAGNGLLITGAATATGLALKGASLAMQATAIGLRHGKQIKAFAGRTLDTVGDNLASLV